MSASPARRPAGAPPEVRRYERRQALLESIGAGDIDACRLAYARGARALFKSRPDQHRLLARAVEHGRAAVCVLLLEMGNDPNVRGVFGEIPLARAAELGWFEVCAALLAGGARPDEMDKAQRRRALHAAVSSGSVRTLEVLIQGKANPDAADDDGFTPLMVAIQLGNAAMAARLIEGGCNLAARSGLGAHTALHIAVLRGDEEIFAILVRAGADLDACNDAGQTPLGVAAANGRREHYGAVLRAVRARERLAGVLEATLEATP